MNYKRINFMNRILLAGLFAFMMTAVISCGDNKYKEIDEKILKEGYDALFSQKEYEEMLDYIDNSLNEENLKKVNDLIDSNKTFFENSEMPSPSQIKEICGDQARFFNFMFVVEKAHSEDELDISNSKKFELISKKGEKLAKKLEEKYNDNNLSEEFDYGNNQYSSADRNVTGSSNESNMPQNNGGQQEQEVKFVGKSGDINMMFELTFYSTLQHTQEGDPYNVYGMVAFEENGGYDGVEVVGTKTNSKLVLTEVYDDSITYEGTLSTEGNRTVFTGDSFYLGTKPQPFKVYEVK